MLCEATVLIMLMHVVNFNAEDVRGHTERGSWLENRLVKVPVLTEIPGDGRGVPCADVSCVIKSTQDENGRPGVEVCIRKLFLH